jgi:hypothetical protein
MVAGIERAFRRAAEASTYFRETLDRLEQLTVKEQQKAHDPVLIAKVVHTGLTTARPRAAYSVKPDPMRVVLNLLPTRLADRLLERTIQR